jgi:hypothetical protein
LENALAAGFGGFGGLGGTSAQGLLGGYGASNEWGNGGHGNGGVHDSPFGARETGRYKRDREEYDQGEFVFSHWLARLTGRNALSAATAAATTELAIFTPLLARSTLPFQS